MASLLLDTHALLWFGAGDQRLPLTVRPRLADPLVEVFVSAATAWEISTKFRLGKLAEAAPFVTNILGHISAFGFQPLPVSLAHGQLAGSLSGAHKDPFDRMLAAQALTENLTLVSNETILDQFGVRRLW